MLSISLHCDLRIPAVYLHLVLPVFLSEKLTSRAKEEAQSWPVVGYANTKNTDHPNPSPAQHTPIHTPSNVRRASEL